MHRTNNDQALREKVEEALTVYDEYLKNNNSGSGEDGAAQANGGENATPAGEADKAGEA